MSADVTCPFRILTVVTAPFFSSAVPTLPLGTAETAAMLVPPSATASAPQARTAAGEGSFQGVRMTTPLVSFSLRPKVPPVERNVRSPA
jgi:hypothetical protein